MWNPLLFIKAWHAKNRRNATSLHGMQRTIPVPDDAMVNVWKIFAQLLTCFIKLLLNWNC